MAFYASQRARFVDLCGIDAQNATLYLYTSLFFQYIFSVSSAICASLSRRTLNVCLNTLAIFCSIFISKFNPCVIVAYLDAAPYIYFRVFRSNFDSVRNCRLFNISDYTLYRNILLKPRVLSSMLDLWVVHANVNMYIDSVFCR